MYSGNASSSGSSSSPALRDTSADLVCNVYQEELKGSGLNLSFMDPCPSCRVPVSRHHRKPVVPVAAASANSNNNSPSMFRDVIKLLPKWKVDYKFCRPFLQRFAQLLTAGNIPAAEWNQLLLICISDVQESEWIQANIVDKKLPWKDTIQAFTKHFELASYREKIEKEFLSCRPHRHESVQHFSDRFVNLCTQLDVKDDDSRAISQFIHSLPNAIQDKIREQRNLLELLGHSFPDESLDKVIKIAISFDVASINSSTSTYADNSSSKPSNSSSSNSSSNNNNNGNDKKKLFCKMHPGIHSHDYAHCRLNPANAQNKSPSSSIKPTSPSAAFSSSAAASKPSETSKTVLCHACGNSGHYASDPKCPKKQATASASSESTTAAKSHAAASSKSAIQARTATVQENDVEVSTVTPSESSEAPTIDRTIPVDVIVPKHQKIVIYAGGYGFFALLDTGASVSFIDESLIDDNKLNLTVNPANTGTINLAHAGHKAQRIGTTSVSFTAHLTTDADNPRSVSMTHLFEILPIHGGDKDYHFIIGTDLIPIFFPSGIPLVFVPPAAKCSFTPTVVQTAHVVESLVDLQQVVHDTGAGDVPEEENPVRISLSTPLELESSHSNKRAKILRELKSLLEINANLAGFCSLPESVVVLKVEVSSADKLYRKQYPIAQALWPLANECIERWYGSGKICLAPPNCPFNNPLTIAPKKDENGKMTGIRICLDTLLLNTMLIINDRFQIPHIRDALEVFAGNELFGEFDLSEAYLQFMIHPDSRQYTAFTWGKKQYMFVGTPYGINFIPSFFQRTMSQIFSDMQFTFPYIDNLPFASKTWEEHYEHAAMIIDRLNQVNLKIKPSSVNLGHAQIKCLGHILSSDGIGIDPEKVQAIHDWSLPSNGNELMSFLGLGTFVRIMLDIMLI
jgi:hypothetical protein